MRSERISISRVHFPITTLGPGRRIGIWFQGCSIRCTGCISADTWADDRGLTDVANLLAEISPWVAEADGVTITGGEPFNQQAALLEVLRGLNLRDDQDLLLFSGYAVERLSETLALASGLIDALISDPFDLSASQTLALRGSDNQRLHLLTDLGRVRFETYNRQLVDADRSLDVMFDDSGTVWLAGIPRRGDMLRLRHLLSIQGDDIRTTDATRHLP
ncbi:4Fe-4S single cluster domain-containing protein [Candidatus Nitrotoga sp. M5]|uniref:4Fe-4S single cluster domain-containing protein n=1 Tax=Candidatus Nitrotoga sp. M5 TaxID=2890409 RepID=UPI001EF683DA|nr:4Fe-4S single cluster domain-containing protein [Candidatus Nitrotoga sp. M5]CAH1387715.1 Radical SAM protein [Candidatus Nitrotoga sp. M5]